MTIENGDIIRVHYSGFLTDGTIFDSSLDHEPLEFELGAGLIISGLETTMPGRKKGEKFKIKIAADDAYGPVDETLFFELPKRKLPSHIQPEIGLGLQLATEEGEIDVRIADVGEQVIIVDANHPLAGQDLIFEVEIMEVIKKRG